MPELRASVEWRARFLRQPLTSTVFHLVNGVYSTIKPKKLISSTTVQQALKFRFIVSVGQTCHPLIFSRSHEWGNSIENRFSNLQDLISAAGGATKITSTNQSVSGITAGTQGAINGTQVNFRSGASTSSSIIRAFSPGEIVTYVGETYDSNGALWYNVKVMNEIGYVHSDFVDFVNSKKKV